MGSGENTYVWFAARIFKPGATQRFMLTILEALRADLRWDTAGKVHIHLLWRCPNHRADSASYASSMCAARANHGIVSFVGDRVFVICRLCEGFACMLEIVAKVFVVKDFGARGRRSGCGANGMLGSTALAGNMCIQLDRRLWRVHAACFWLESNFWTRQDMTR